MVGVLPPHRVSDPFRFVSVYVAGLLFTAPATARVTPTLARPARSTCPAVVRVFTLLGVLGLARVGRLFGTSIGFVCFASTDH